MLMIKHLFLIMIISKTPSHLLERKADFSININMLLYKGYCPSRSSSHFPMSTEATFMKQGQRNGANSNSGHSSLGGAILQHAHVMPEQEVGYLLRRSVLN